MQSHSCFRFNLWGRAKIEILSGLWQFRRAHSSQRRCNAFRKLCSFFTEREKRKKWGIFLLNREATRKCLRVAMCGPGPALPQAFCTCTAYSDCRPRIGTAVQRCGLLQKYDCTAAFWSVHTCSYLCPSLNHDGCSSPRGARRVDFSVLPSSSGQCWSVLGQLAATVVVFRGAIELLGEFWKMEKGKKKKNICFKFFLTSS